jgi:TRAP-type C4-dicarboxylate transport system permease small subunit
VGYLTALGIGLGLAHCALQSGHIAVGILIERLPLKIQGIVDFTTNSIALVFWGLSAWQLTSYAKSMAINGLVSSTAKLPIAPIIYLIALGLASLCLVLLVRTVDSFTKMLAYLSQSQFARPLKLTSAMASSVSGPVASSAAASAATSARKAIR